MTVRYLSLTYALWWHVDRLLPIVNQINMENHAL